MYRLPEKAFILITVTSSTKVSGEFINSGIFTPSIETSMPTRDPSCSFKSYRSCFYDRILGEIYYVVIVMAYSYFELGIEQDSMHKPLLIPARNRAKLIDFSSLCSCRGGVY